MRKNAVDEAWDLSSACMPTFQFLLDRGYTLRDGQENSVWFVSERVTVHVFRDVRGSNLNETISLVGTPYSDVGFQEMEIALGRTAVDVYRPATPEELNTDLDAIRDRLVELPVGVLDGSTSVWEELLSRVSLVRNLATKLGNERAAGAVPIDRRSATPMGLDRVKGLVDRSRQELIEAFQDVLKNIGPFPEGSN
ncbi:MAG TPA: hypothetical protein VHZ81_13760 [Galbitalea sp.]|nr:hypothetical protein [Galbitalea sp.]